MYLSPTFLKSTCHWIQWRWLYRCPCSPYDLELVCCDGGAFSYLRRAAPRTNYERWFLDVLHVKKSLIPLEWSSWDFLGGIIVREIQFWLAFTDLNVGWYLFTAYFPVVLFNLYDWALFTSHRFKWSAAEPQLQKYSLDHYQLRDWLSISGSLWIVSLLIKVLGRSYIPPGFSIPVPVILVFFAFFNWLGTWICALKSRRIFTMISSRSRNYPFVTWSPMNYGNFEAFIWYW